MSQEFHYPCLCGCNRTNACNKLGNYCGLPECTKNWNEAGLLMKKYKPLVIKKLK